MLELEILYFYMAVISVYTLVSNLLQM